MPKIDPLKIKADLSKDLRDLADLLRHQMNPICSNVGPVYQASEECSKSHAEDLFEYSLHNLNFRVNVFKKSIPAKLKDITVTLSVSVKGLCVPIVIDGISDIYNPFKALQFNIILNGRYKNGGRDKTVYSSWHLDRDEEEGRENQEYIHPFYHFQHGGRMMDRGLNYGASLIIDTPRIAHPPMDGILGIDFILTNFVERERIQDLRANTDYKRIIKNAQTRIWRPYLMTLARAWSIENSSEWCAKVLFPQLIK